MKCQHTATDVHGAKMTCTAEGSMKVTTDVSEDHGMKAGCGAALKHEYYCPDHVEIHDDTKRPGISRGKKHLLIDVDLDRLREFGRVNQDNGLVSDLLAETLENFARMGFPDYKQVWTTNAAHVGIARLVTES